MALPHDWDRIRKCFVKITVSILRIPNSKEMFLKKENEAIKVA